MELDDGLSLEAEKFAEEQVAALQEAGKIRKEETKAVMEMMKAYYKNYADEIKASDEAMAAHKQKVDIAALTFIANSRNKIIEEGKAAEYKAAMENSLAIRKEELRRIQDANKQELEALEAKKIAGLITEDELNKKKDEHHAKEMAYLDDISKMNEQIRKAAAKANEEEYNEKLKQLAAEKAEREKLNSGAGIKAAGENFKAGGDNAVIAGIGALAKGLENLNPKKMLSQKTDDAKKKAEASAQNVKNIQKELDDAKAAGASEEELAEIIKRGQDAQLEATKDANKANALEMANAMVDKLGGMFKEAEGEALNILGEYMGKIDARMQGSDKSFKSMQGLIANNLALSPFVKTTEVMKKLNEAVEKGLSYNTEQRAFLASISDKIATTFDAFDSSLLRIIRLQQADSTIARMGMEASLTKFLNGMFQDSSYLSGVHDSVSSALVDANSQLNTAQAAEFEYIMHKWLGALSSVGLSDETVTEIAKGVNYLATGDVTNMSNSNSLQTLFAMAASNANMEYSELLLEGMDAQKTNQLMSSMVMYLKEIAENSENQVVKSAYGGIFNMSLSDMRAISNLSEGDISTIAGNSMSYSSMQAEMDTQMMQLVNRTSVAQRFENVFDNVMYNAASDLVNNPVVYALQKTIDFMDSTGTDINIPFINAAGFGLDLNTSVLGLMKMGMGLTQAFSIAGSVLSGLGSSGGKDLSAWNAEETTRRGAGINLSTTSTIDGVSGSIGSFVTNSNSSDVKDSSISAAADDAEETKKLTNKHQQQPEKTMDDLFENVIGLSSSSVVMVRDKDPYIAMAMDESMQALRVFDPRMIFEDTDLLVHDNFFNKIYEESDKAIRAQDMRLVISEAGLLVHDPLVRSEIERLSLSMLDPTNGLFSLLTSGLGSLFGVDFGGDDKEPTFSGTAAADPVLQAIFNNADNTIRTIDDRFTFDEKNLLVADTKIVEVVEAEMKAIRTIMTDPKEGISTVRISDDSVVRVDAEEMRSLLTDVLYGEDANNVGKLIKTIDSGSLVVNKINDAVPVKNALGDKLQVSNLIW